jgi:trehalose 6-phosphate phosphatase
MEISSDRARRRYADLVEVAPQAVVALDFDGTLAPIVDDPAEAYVHPDAGDVLVGLGAQVRAVAVVTGRPVRQVLELGDLREVGGRIGEAGGELHVLGQYGNERWTTREPRVHSPRPPRGLASFMAELPQLLRQADAAEAHLEEKGLAVAVHTRRLPEPAAAQERVAGVLGKAAGRHGLVLEPGRMVVEVRSPGMDKGAAVRALKKRLHADGMLFAGDDLGDLQAFEAVADLRRGGMVGLLVCSGSEEQEALVELADVVVPGPEGVMELLAAFTRDAAGRAGDAPAR